MVVALVSFTAGVIKGCPGNPHRDAAENYLKAWSSGDYRQMYDALSTTSRGSITYDRFTDEYEQAESTSTLVSLRQEGDAQGDEQVVLLPTAAQTRAFGMVQQQLRVTFGSDGIAWESSLLFPGLKPGEGLARDTEMPIRAPLLTKDGGEMAKGPATSREHPLGDAMLDVTGTVGQGDEELMKKLARYGYDPGDPVGIGGLELAFNARLGGTPGGTLAAVSQGSTEVSGGRVLGTGAPKRAKPLRTTIDANLQTTTVAALAGRSGGAAVLDARTGVIRALAGQAWSVLQPPGSTMKIVTATAGLAAGKVKLTDSFDYVTEAPADGRMIKNAHEEVCGGTFVQSFAMSCNSVFAPLGMEIGEKTFTQTAERFGFNKPPAMYSQEITELVDPPIPTVPQPGEYNNELGVSAIGQGTVQATPLLMASVAQTIANKGISLPTPVTREPDLAPDREPVRVSGPKVASQVTELMKAVVISGTGYASAVANHQVAGKTGTAELGPSGEVNEEGEPEMAEDAWFAAFAPADKPRLALAVMIIDAPGDGGTVAAPIAGSIFAAGL